LAGLILAFLGGWWFRDYLTEIFIKIKFILEYI